MIQPKKSALPFLLIVAACFALYGQTLGFHFVWDDYAEVVNQGEFRQWAHLDDFFLKPYWMMATGGFAPYHRPMIPVMILLISTFSGIQPFGYHLLNVVMFSLTSCLFYAFLKRLPISTWAAGFSALVFILHPVHAEAVSWGSARPVLLSGLCFISLLILSSRLAENSPRKILWGGIALLYATGLLTYHSILALPVLVFFMDLLALPQSKPWKIRLREYLLYVLLTGACLFYFLWVFRRAAGETDLTPYYNPATANIVYTGGPWEWLLTPLNTLTRYSELLLFPVFQTPDAYFKSTGLSLSALAAFAALTAMSFFVLKKTIPKKPLIFSLLWMAAGILTVSNIVPQGGLFADRYLYISSMGFALWLALVFEYLKNSLASSRAAKGGLAFLMTGLICFYGMRTLEYSRIWSNEIGFWLEASTRSPHKARTHNKLGILMQAGGHDREAGQEFRKVLDLAPQDFIPTYRRLAEVLEKSGKTEEAQILRAKYEEEMQKAQAASDPFSNPDDTLLRIN